MAAFDTGWTQRPVCETREEIEPPRRRHGLFDKRLDVVVVGDVAAHEVRAGRAAAAYKARFGETPRESLRRR